MKEKRTAILYYSYTGHTAKLAQSFSERPDTDLFEIKDQNRPGTLKAYTLGCINAMRMKPSPILPVEANLATYGRIVIFCPVWASHPAPAVNSVFDMLPAGKDVEVYMVSASGRSAARNKVTLLVRGKGCKMIKYEDIKAQM